MSTMSGADSLFSSFSGEGGFPDLHLETMLAERGRRVIAGVDEAGRGPLAGPVVAAAAILDPHNIPDGINDSKKLGQCDRNRIFNELAQHAQIAWCAVQAADIDRINIRQATLLAMSNAVHALPAIPDAALVDGRDIPVPLRDRATAVIGGDARSLSIAAASIVAKVIRDRLMSAAEICHPGYGFARHKGYATPQHLAALRSVGPCPLHRRSFAPVANCQAPVMTENAAALPI